MVIKLKKSYSNEVIYETARRLGLLYLYGSNYNNERQLTFDFISNISSINRYNSNPTIEISDNFFYCYDNTIINLIMHVNNLPLCNKNIEELVDSISIADNINNFNECKIKLEDIIDIDKQLIATFINEFEKTSELLDK